MNEILSKPNLFDYLDAYSFLQDYYTYRKKMKTDFSYQAWADELNFNSRSFLRMMVMGKKKLTPKIIESMSQQQFSTKDEQDYFFFMVKYSQASSVKDRQIFGQKMTQILKLQITPKIISDNDEFASEPILPCLLSLFSYEDIVPTITNLARIINRSESDTLMALVALQKMGFVQQDEDTQLWHSKVRTFRVPDNKGSSHLRKFHEISLKNAIKAFDLPLETRRYKSLMLPLSNDDYQAFNSLLDDFAKEQLSRYDVKYAEGKRVFQVNFNIYPLTEKIEAQTK